MTQNILAVLVSLAVAAVPVAAQAPASGLTHIGNAAAVRGAVKAMSEGASVGRVVDSGKPLYLNDHVTTDAAGRLQVLLLDETVFTLGPNSDMVLDTFVYDPATSKGKVDAKISKGTFRFVTGKVARRDPSQMKIKLAVGTIGVRGSIGVGETGPGGSTIINGGARNADDHEDNAGIYAEHHGKTIDLTQPGAGTHLSPDGGNSGAKIMKGDLDRIMGTLKTDTAKGGKGGGGDLAGGGNADEKSGHSTAAGGEHAGDTGDLADLTGSLNKTLVNTVQSINAGSTLSTWDDLRNIGGGVGTYVGNGTWTCISGSCSGTGAFDFSIPVDFTNKLIGNGGSIHVSAGSGLLADTGNMISTSFAGMSGQATMSLVSGSNISLGSPNSGTFSGKLTFSNVGSTPAKSLTVDLHYVGTTGAPTVTGSATGNR